MSVPTADPSELLRLCATQEQLDRMVNTYIELMQHFQEHVESLRSMQYSPQIIADSDECVRRLRAEQEEVVQRSLHVGEEIEDWKRIHTA
eukprot:m51a1_g6942 hypothetical protein (90) ;mRNA; f:245547-245816